MPNTNDNRDELLKIEVAYAQPDKQLILTLQVPTGATALSAVEQSGIAAKFPGLDISTAKLGIFGKNIKPSQELRAGDRVEIYRPLIADPKQARRDRAKADK